MVADLRSVDGGRDRYAGVDRIPPNNIEAEMALLGSVLIDRNVMTIVSEIVQPSDFYTPLHESIFRALHALFERDEPLDKVALAEELRGREMLDKIGGIAYLSSLMESVPTAASAEYYASVVREKANLRALIHAGTVVTRLGYDGEHDVASATEEARTVVELATTRQRDQRTLEPIGKTAVDVWTQLFEAGASRLVRPPWRKLAAITGNFSPKQMSAWLAAPGAGKTGILCDVCACTAYQQSDLGAVVLVSLELDKPEIIKRTIAHFSGVPRARLEPGEFGVADEPKILNAISVLDLLRLIILDGEYSVSQLRATLRRIRREQGAISLIAVDSPAYLHDVAYGGRESSKHERFEDALKQLRRLAVELDAHVTIAHHLNRKGVENPKQPPTMLQARDGGNLEGTADLVILPWLPNVGYETTPLIGQMRAVDGDADAEADRARLEALGRWIIGKNRKGKGQGRWIDDLQFVGSRFTWVEGESGRPWWWHDANIRAMLAADRQVPMFTTDGGDRVQEQFDSLLGAP